MGLSSDSGGSSFYKMSYSKPAKATHHGTKGFIFLLPCLSSCPIHQTQRNSSRNSITILFFFWRLGFVSASSGHLGFLASCWRLGFVLDRSGSHFGGLNSSNEHFLYVLFVSLAVLVLSVGVSFKRTKIIIIVFRFAQTRDVQ